MNTEMNSTRYQVVLDDETEAKFAHLLNDESLMHAGFVAHQSNNNTLTLELGEEVKEAA